MAPLLAGGVGDLDAVVVHGPLQRGQLARPVVLGRAARMHQRPGRRRPQVRQIGAQPRPPDAAQDLAFVDDQTARGRRRQQHPQRMGAGHQVQRGELVPRQVDRQRGLGQVVQRQARTLDVGGEAGQRRRVLHAGRDQAARHRRHGHRRIGPHRVDHVAQARAALARGHRRAERRRQSDRRPQRRVQFLRMPRLQRIGQPDRDMEGLRLGYVQHAQQGLLHRRGGRVIRHGRTRQRRPVVDLPLQRRARRAEPRQRAQRHRQMVEQRHRLGAVHRAETDRLVQRLVQTRRPGRPLELELVVVRIEQVQRRAVALGTVARAVGIDAHAAFGQPAAQRGLVERLDAQAEVVDVAPLRARPRAPGAAELAVQRHEVDQLRAGAQLHQADRVLAALDRAAEQVHVEVQRGGQVPHPQDEVVEALDLDHGELLVLAVVAS